MFSDDAHVDKNHEDMMPTKPKAEVSTIKA